MLKNNLNGLKDTYEKKNSILDQMIHLEKDKQLLLDNEDFDIDGFDDLVNQQDGFVDKLSSLENTVDEAVKNLELELQSSQDSLKAEKDLVKVELKKMDEKIKMLTELESSNQLKLRKQLETEKENLKVGRRSSKAALDYYKNMSGSHVVPPHFMDQKQ